LNSSIIIHTLKSTGYFGGLVGEKCSTFMGVRDIRVSYFFCIYIGEKQKSRSTKSGSVRSRSIKSGTVRSKGSGLKSMKIRAHSKASMKAIKTIEMSRLFCIEAAVLFSCSKSMYFAGEAPKASANRAMANSSGW